MENNKPAKGLSGCLFRVAITLVICLASYFVLPYVVPYFIPTTQRSNLVGPYLWLLVVDYWPYLLVSLICYGINLWAKKSYTIVKYAKNGDARIFSPIFVDISKILAIIILSLVFYSASHAILAFGVIVKFGSILFFSFSLGFLRSNTRSYLQVSNQFIKTIDPFGLEDQIEKTEIENIRVDYEKEKIIFNEVPNSYKFQIEAKSLNISLNKSIEVLKKFGYPVE
jgi:hypothetical protein